MEPAVSTNPMVPRQAPASISEHGTGARGHRLSSSQTLLRTAAAGACRKFGRLKVAAAAGKRSSRQRGNCRLLVDADSMSMANIRLAADMLRKKGWSLDVELFAPPQRRENTKWRAFMDELDIRFHGVSRSGGFKDLNDEALIARALQLAHMPMVNCISLLVSDSDYVDLVGELALLGKRAVVIVPENRLSILARYNVTTADVWPLPLPGVSSTLVQAILHKTGNGSVQLCDKLLLPSVEDEDRATALAFLANLGYISGTGDNIVSLSLAQQSFGFGISRSVWWCTQAALRFTLCLTRCGQ
ncbi:unnamed protein product [Effrenium voratum]|uniref:Uncharacterized protein n=1 Tax=Effrenium voratum TaxID=2562239 RepID=A0AA36MUZ1_9DINO|nr:unnamed protein product [Effrenium voratum]CAJ1420410.1 unnamed protein product [Effrenium voratum]